MIVSCGLRRHHNQNRAARELSWLVGSRREIRVEVVGELAGGRVAIVGRDREGLADDPAKPARQRPRQLGRFGRARRELPRLEAAFGLPRRPAGKQIERERAEAPHVESDEHRTLVEIVWI